MVAQTPPISPLSEQYSFDMDEQGNKPQVYVTETAIPILANPFTTPPHSPLQSDIYMRTTRDQTMGYSATQEFMADSHLSTMLCDPINLLRDEHDILVGEDGLKSAIDWMIPM